jgi:hypothetical protein
VTRHGGANFVAGAADSTAVLSRGLQRVCSLLASLLVSCSRQPQEKCSCSSRPRRGLACQVGKQFEAEGLQRTDTRGGSRGARVPWTGAPWGAPGRQQRRLEC